MCGRFTLHTPPDVLREHFGLDEAPQIPEANYNITPSQGIQAVRATNGRREMVPLHWGLIPSWSRDTRTGNRMINARAETVAVKPAYRTAFRKRRCLIPADGFYEWRQTESGKQPYHIRMKDGGVFAFAGLWERWVGYDESIESCSIIVTEANDTIRLVHDRMPVILAPRDYSQWLDPAVTDGDRLTALLRPYAASAMVAYPITKRVNDPANNDDRCIEPVAG
jgi:putative SOS response-associated peptidase YedK